MTNELGKRAEHFSKRVLVVEDDPQVLKLSETMLKLSGYQVACAMSADEAMGLLTQSLQEKKPFDVALIDLILPGEHGDLLIGKIKQVAPEMATLLVTGATDESFTHDTYEAYGFDGKLTKPFSSEELAYAVDWVLAKKAALNKKSS